MKIKVTRLDYEKVMAKTPWKHRKPVRQSRFFRWLISVLAISELKAVDFSLEKINMDKVSDDEPVLFLMNHSCFTDLMIAAHILKNREYHIVCTNDGFVGKEALMRYIGCIPTKKFITDVTLVKDMKYTFDKLKASVLLFPEASYSFDGTATSLPASLGKCVRMMKVPVVMIRTRGAFLRDPLYNKLQKRKVSISATMELIVTKDECKTLPENVIFSRITEHFEYDHFKEQKADNVLITEPFRADGLNRALYKCDSCGCEGMMEGAGVKITCRNCGRMHTLLEDGTLKAGEGETRFSFVTDWYAWERECVRNEIRENRYQLDIDVKILMLVDSKSIYDVGKGHLHHDAQGFVLTGCDGKLNYSQNSTSSYSLYSDYFWYEIGDMICIGDTMRQYYCFAENENELIAAKARLATEEIYKNLSEGA